ncbi:prephenate dehydratase [Euzebya sp.]|uniref:prephenate dehydratase n=1 Tax=Euzebya sp. TaxID=1971409 RepID=UPI003519119A
MTVAFLGPEGTFTAAAADRAAPGHERLPLTTIPDVVDLVRDGTADVGVVPIENSIEGAVNLTLDTLAFGEPGVYIRGEVEVPISMNLLVRPGTSLDAVKEVRSHPMAIPQCRVWLSANLSGVQLSTTASTAAAAEEVVDGDGTVAALGTTAAAERFGLEVLAADIHDRDGNTTRFVTLGRRMPGPTGADKTSLVVFFGADRPGQLMRVLDEFALRGINLTKIESRPTKTQLGEYCIFIDASGHVTEARMAEALRSVHRHVAEVRILGTYPRADGLTAHAAGADSEDAYADASLWFRRLLDRIDT